MSNEGDRKRRLRELFSKQSLPTLAERAERLALLHLESGTLLSDDSIEVMAAALVFNLACNAPQLQPNAARYHEVLRGLALFEELRAPVLAPLHALCTECGQRLPHDAPCAATDDPEACS